MYRTVEQKSHENNRLNRPEAPAKMDKRRTPPAARLPRRCRLSSFAT